MVLEISHRGSRLWKHDLIQTTGRPLHQIVDVDLRCFDFSTRNKNCGLKILPFTFGKRNRAGCRNKIVGRWNIDWPRHAINAECGQLSVGVIVVGDRLKVNGVPVPKFRSVVPDRRVVEHLGDIELVQFPFFFFNLFFGLLFLAKNSRKHDGCSSLKVGFSFLFLLVLFLLGDRIIIFFVAAPIATGDQENRKRQQADCERPKPWILGNVSH